MKLKNYIQILTLIISLLAINSCKKEDTPVTPTVDFNYTGANVPAPALVSFKNNTSNATSYLWDFGDNGTSTSANPQHLYALGGVYTVKLTATGPGGSTSATKTVNINAPLTKVKITKVTVIDLPFTKSGGTSGWDIDGTGPDVYFQIQDKNSKILFDITSAERYNNINPASLPIFWNLPTPFAIADLNETIFINLFDYDFGTSDEDMSYVGFNMKDYTNGSNAYPSKVIRTQNGITVTLDLNWY